MKKNQMVDLQGQYEKIKPEVDEAIFKVINNTSFINGTEVSIFSDNLKSYLGTKFLIPCANGTDALQIALMALEIEKGSEIILPSFNYVATAEVIALLGLIPVFVDVNDRTFNIDASQIDEKITNKTKAIMAVHLFGQCAEMEEILAVAKRHNLFVIEDNAQSIGSLYGANENKQHMSGTMGDIGTTSFFPSKNLGCMGDGGALYTNNETLAEKIKMIANHGQRKKYTYEMVGINSRLDTIQAALLDVKLKRLNEYIASRQEAAQYYDRALNDLNEVEIPYRSSFSTHVFHQYTLKVREGVRDELQKDLQSKGIPTMIYYPSPLHLQNAYRKFGYREGDFPISERLCKSVISLPMHTELQNDQLEYITNSIKEFFSKLK